MISEQMRRMPRSSTRPELAIRRALHRSGLRFRVNFRGLPGRPDVAFTKARLAVFVDGCFWHMCPAHVRLPKNNRAWWVAKLEANVARDQEKDRRLAELGWLSVHVWEHEDPVSASERIAVLWSELRRVPRLERPI
ncbi:very short patch repair endonuclease [Micromonospora parva]|uniref:very short patch repair endonuclease n=1 Tax=Micromonospora parva TaxID=1464048 RepID=UPI0033E73977